MEFILVFAFSLLIILPIINILHSEYNQSKEQLDEAQAAKVLDEIYLAAQTTYYSGYPSRTTLELYFPRGISNVRSTTVDTAQGEKSELVFEIDTGIKHNNMVRLFPFKLNTTISPNEGNRRILIKAEQGDFINITDAR